MYLCSLHANIESKVSVFRGYLCKMYINFGKELDINIIATKSQRAPSCTKKALRLSVYLPDRTTRPSSEMRIQW